MSEKTHTEIISQLADELVLASSIQKLALRLKESIDRLITINHFMRGENTIPLYLCTTDADGNPKKDTMLHLSSEIKMEALRKLLERETDEAETIKIELREKLSQI